MGSPMRWQFEFRFEGSSPWPRSPSVTSLPGQGFEPDLFYGRMG
jgi:hypothetical protein